MKKWIALLLAIIIMSSASGCGTSQPAPTETIESEVPATEYLPYEGETLTVLYMSGEHAETARAMIPDFEALTGAKVVVVDYAYQDLYNQALLDLTSYIGSYDVINIDSLWDGTFAPYLEPLDEYISQDKYDMNVWIDNVLANCGQWQDQIIGIPTSCMAQVFAYRTDLLPNGIPKTWMAYRSALMPLNKPLNGMYGIAVSKMPDQLLNLFNSVLWSMDGRWADEDWKVTINSMPARSALNHMNAVKLYSDPACKEWSPSDALQAFLDGKAAVCETFPLPELLQKGNDPEHSQIVDNWALGLIPYEKNGINTLTAWDAVIPVGSQNKKLAWEWIKMYTSYEKQNEFYDDFGILSPRKEFWEQDKMADLSVVREAIDTANNGWRISAFRAAEANIKDTLASFVTAKIYQDTAIRRMDAEIKTVLENIPVAEGIKNNNR